VVCELLALDKQRIVFDGVIVEKRDQVRNGLQPHDERLCDDIALINRGKVVLDGSLASVRAAYATNRIRLRSDGPVEDLTSISGTSVYALGTDWVELALDAGVSVTAVLRNALERASLSQFNVVEPTLHEIFVRTVTHSNKQQVASI